MNKQIMIFQSERELSNIFSPENCIRFWFEYTEWSSWEGQELEGLFGIPDHIAVFWKYDKLDRRISRTFAFEMKRYNWKRALMQAYRYSSFANYSFVVLDHAYVHRAIASINDFRRANIGLLSVRLDGEVFWHFRPIYRIPYSKHLTHLLHAALDVHVFDGENTKSNINSYYSNRTLKSLKRQ